MTSTYRRDHIKDNARDEFERLSSAGQSAIVTAVTSFEALYPLPVASSGEKLALRRAFARFMIDSGKASRANMV